MPSRRVYPRPVVEVASTTALPAPTRTWRAIEVYLRHAYPGSPPPRRVEETLEALRRADVERFYDAAPFERDAGPPSRYALRLGNSRYPHMKLLLEHLASRGVWLFRADTHDRHVHVDPDHPDHASLRELMNHNHAVSMAIERAWAVESLDTFRSLLHRDLERRGAR